MSTSWTTVFEPVDASSTYEETVTRLGTAIRIGILPAGTRLPPERELAERLAISRSTLRQALATLTATGHLKALRGRAGGTFVAEAPPISSGERVPRELLQPLLDRRLALELGVAQLAAERSDDGDDERLVGAAAAFEDAVERDFASYRRADAALHLAIAEAAGSPRLVAELARLHGRLSDLLAEVGVPPAMRREDAEQHRRIVEGVRRRDAAQALTATREHLQATERLLAERGQRRTRVS